jgi:hypothetical protein
MVVDIHLTRKNNYIPFQMKIQFTSSRFSVVFFDIGEMEGGKSMGIMFSPSVSPWQTEESSENLFMLPTGRPPTSMRQQPN